MSWISDAWGGFKDALGGAWDSISDIGGDVWDSAKDAVKDVTGIESMNDLLYPGFGVSSGMAALQGRGLVGDFLNPLLQPPGGVGPGGMTGPLSQAAPPMSMGTASAAASRRSAPQDLASYFGGSDYAFGPTETSAALLRANPEAYKFAPLTSGLT